MGLTTGNKPRALQGKKNKMLDIEKALEIVNVKIGAVENDYLILRDSTIEEDFGWVIFYASKKHIETGDIKYVLASNSPCIVNRITGEAVFTGTAHSIETYVKAYKITGSPHGEIVPKIHITTWLPGASAVKAIKALRDELHLNLKEAKTIIDFVLKNEEQFINCSSEEQARKLEIIINQFGFCCSIVWGSNSARY